MYPVNAVLYDYLRSNARAFPFQSLPAQTAPHSPELRSTEEKAAIRLAELTASKPCRTVAKPDELGALERQSPGNGSRLPRWGQ